MSQAVLVGQLCHTGLRSSLSLAGIQLQMTGHVGGIVVRVSDLGLKGPMIDTRVVPKSECMFVNIYHY